MVRMRLRTTRNLRVSCRTGFGCVGGGVVNQPDAVGVDPGVASVVAGWRPANLVASKATLESVLPLARVWVLAANPTDGHDARRLLRAVTGILIWGHRVVGTVDPATVLDPDTVEVWVMHVNKSRSRMWRHVARGALRRVGRAVHPDGWPPAPQAIRRAETTTPYDFGEEQTFRLSAGLRGRVDRAARLWVTAATLGAGLSGPELVAGRVGDVTELASGLVIEVRGRNARLAPVRRVWTDSIVEAVKAAGLSDGFVTAQGRNTVHSVAQRLAPVNGDALSLSRARATFLTAHLAAGTSLPALRMIAGPVSMGTLDVLVGVAGEGLDPVAVCLWGLNA